MFAVIQHDHFDPKDGTEIDRQVHDTGEGARMLNRMSIGVTAAALLTALTLVGNASADDALPSPGISPGGNMNGENMNIERFASKEDEGLARLQDKIAPVTTQTLPNIIKMHHETAKKIIESFR